MLEFIVNGKVEKFESLEELFKTRRQERNKIFGTYLTDLGDKDLDKKVLIEKVKGQITTLEDYLQNLKQLKSKAEEEFELEEDLRFIEGMGNRIENPRTKERAIEKLKELGLIQ